MRKRYYAMWATTAAVIALAPATTEAATFTDLTHNTHAEAIQQLVQQGIISGYVDGTFRPEQTLTRSDAVKMIGKWLVAIGYDLPQDANTKARFTDVAANHHNDLVQYAALLYDYGIFLGADGELKPHEKMTRENMALILTRAYDEIYGVHTIRQLEKQEVTSGITDLQLAKEEAHLPLQLLSYLEITNQSQFKPKQAITRGQFASFVARSQIIDMTKLTTTEVVAGSIFGDSDGALRTAQFRTPTAITTLADGSLAISDKNNQKIKIIKEGNVSTYAGTTIDWDDYGMPKGGLINGKVEQSLLQEPTAVTTGPNNEIWIADTGNHAIRKIVNGELQTVAGNGIQGTADGAGEQARFYSPQSIVVNKKGEAYVADTMNHVIRKIATDGTVTTINAPASRMTEWNLDILLVGSFRDGKITEAQFNAPMGLALDEHDNLYVSDTGNHLIRYMDFTNHTVKTVAGDPASITGQFIFEKGGNIDGKAIKARFNSPRGLYYDEAYGLLITDTSNGQVRLLRNGQVHTIATKMKQPTSITKDKDAWYITDAGDHQIKQFYYSEKE